MKLPRLTAIQGLNSPVEISNEIKAWNNDAKRIAFTAPKIMPSYVTVKQYLKLSKNEKAALLASCGALGTIANI
jgi:hypothetical protein